MKRRKQYAEEFKREVLRMAANSEKPVGELEKDLGLSQGLIRQWQHRYHAESILSLQIAEHNSTK
jgi:transposase-like protein